MHHPTPKELAPQSEAAAEDTGVFEKQSAPSEAVGSAEVLEEVQDNYVGIDLVEWVIGKLGRVDHFDTASLKALRATCKGIRDLLDSADVLSAAHFSVNPHNFNTGCDLLEAWTAGTRLTPRTRSLSIHGELPAKLAEQVLAALIDQRPPISKLTLTYVCAEELLTAPLNTLRELRLASVFQSSRILTKVVNNTSFSGLQSLIINRVDNIDASDFAAAMALFQDQGA